jgi:hypothetical protein
MPDFLQDLPFGIGYVFMDLLRQMNGRKEILPTG